jgi:flagellar biosynthetic protein FliP
VSQVLTRSFARHYAEMVVVMLVGMGALALPAQWTTDAVWPSVDGDDTTLMLARMGVTMTLPMIPWMRWRGHGWRPTLEMAAAMIVPAIGVIALLEAGAVEGVGLLMTLEHVVMFIAMFAVMAARPDEYSHPHHHATAITARARVAPQPD